MIIILEGCDKTGKTTLAKELCIIFNLKYVKVSAPKKDAFKEYVKLIKEVKEPTLFDRFHLGEEVYGPIMRGKSQLKGDKFNKVEDLLQKENAIIIYTHNTSEFIANKFKEDNETFTRIEDIDKIKEYYDKVLLKTKLPVLKYKIGDNVVELLNNIFKNI